MMAQTSNSTRFHVGGMDCASCVAKVDTAVRRIPGVTDVAVSLASSTMTVRHTRDSDLGAIERKVTGLGYQVAALPNGGPDHPRGEKAFSGPWWQTGKRRLTIVSGLSLLLALVITAAFPAFGPSAFIAAMLVGLVPVARRAFAAAMSGTPFSIEMLMTIAAVGAVAIGAGEEAATVVFLFLLGELLEGVAAGATKQAIAAFRRQGVRSRPCFAGCCITSRTGPSHSLNSVGYCGTTVGS
jgi:Cd2+/Zn2+-exporting ATPase